MALLFCAGTCPEKVTCSFGLLSPDELKLPLPKQESPVGPNRGAQSEGCKECMLMEDIASEAHRERSDRAAAGIATLAAAAAENLAGHGRPSQW